MSNKEKKKREKVTYIDDGRTIADMSNLPTRGLGRSLSDARPKKEMSETEKQFYRSRPAWRDHISTYFAAVKMMILPMLVTIGILTLAFLIFYILANLA
ncbi:MAG: hypothetical protein II319_02510 [Clostridia bacterium]|nr:hypothetical protein [Clostridia bacterium]